MYKRFILGLMFVIIFIVSGCTQTSKSICGNGVVEAGETYQNCCVDAGCLGDQECDNNVCINPVCGGCEFLQGFQCITYGCCEDSDCDDKNQKTIDTCENPKSQQSRCVHEQATCSDGTSYDQCSKAMPGYCDGGILVDNCELCGCPGDQECKHNLCVAEQWCEGETDCLDVAVVQFYYMNDPKRDFTYEFYCNEDNCEFLGMPIGINQACRTVEACRAYYSSRCGENCHIQQLSVYEAFGNPQGTTKITPINSNVAKYTYPSVYQVTNFYQRESAKYREDIQINIHVLGPFATSQKPPQRLRDESSIELEEFFDRETEKNAADVDDFDMVNYVYFTSENWFVSTVGYRKTFNQAFLSFDSLFQTIKTITHETAHILGGATDKYTGFACNYPEGYAEPNKSPLYPQTKACLMCEKIMLEETHSRGPQNMDELIICEETARELGWI